MRTSSGIPHGHLSDEVNHNIIQSEIEGGIYLADLEPGIRLEFRTEHHCYSLTNIGKGRVRISGHPEFCPTPVEVTLCGSNWGGSLLKSGYLGRGMRLEFRHPSRDLITTSRIVEIRQIS
jgi:hypothetical protein